MAVASTSTASSSMPVALVVGEIGLVRSLGEAGIPLYVGSHYDDNVALYSRYCLRRIHFSHPTSEAFVEELIELGKSENQKMVFFSDDDRAVMTFSRNRERLAPYYIFNLPPHETVNAVLDKREFALLSRKLDLPVPRSFAPMSREEVERCAAELAFPCIIKPSCKDDWWHPDFVKYVGPYRKAIECDSKQTLLDYYDKIIKISPRMVVQELIQGDDLQLYSVNMYFDSARRMLGYFIGHKLRIYPIHAGVATIVETMENDEMMQLALAAAQKLEMQGHFNIQFKQDVRTGALRIMEVHTRNSLWCYLSTGAGRNISAIAYFDMTGLKNPLPDQYQAGVKWIDLNRDVKALFDYRKIGELSYGQWIKSFQGKRVHHIFSISDIMPGVRNVVFLLGRRVKKEVADGAAPPP